MQARKAHAALLECLTQIPMVTALGERNFDWVARQLSLPGISSNEFDFDRLRLLTAFITRVRHNGFNRIAPLSMSFMFSADLDFELFAGYAGNFLELKSRPEFNETMRFREFMDYVRCTEKEKNDWQLRMLLDLMCYEQRLLADKRLASMPSTGNDSSTLQPGNELRRGGLPDSHSSPPQAAGYSDRLLDQSKHHMPPEAEPPFGQYPHAVKVLGVDRYCFHPNEIMEALPFGLVAFSTLVPVNALLAVVQGDENTIEILEVDPVAAALLSLANGKRSVQAITEEMSHLHRLALTQENVAELLEQLQQANLIEGFSF